MRNQKTNYITSVTKILFLFLTISLNAQSLRVIDNITLEPIPYASIEIYEIQIQSYCDENGEYKIEYTYITIIYIFLK